MKYSRLVIISIILSVGLHLLFFGIAANIHISSGFAGDSVARQQHIDSIDDFLPIRLTQPIEQPNNEQPGANNSNGAMDAPTIAPPAPPLADNGQSATPVLPPVPVIPGQESQAIAKLLEQAQLYEEPVTVYEIAGVNGAQAPVFSETALQETIATVTAPRPELLEIKASELPQSRIELPGRMEAPALVRAPVPESIQLPSLAQEGPLLGSYSPAATKSLELRAGRVKFGGLPSADLVPPMPAGTGGPGSGGGAGLPTLSHNGDISDRLGVQSPAGAPKPLDEFVEVSVVIRRDQTGNGGCFQVDIKPTSKSDVLADIPKDVLFIIDRSESISISKYKQFKLTIQEALTGLSRQDRFNIVSFTDEAQPIFKNFVAATPLAIQRASEAVNRLPHGGRTDVFGGLAPFVRQSNSNRLRPLNIFLLTDGQSTVNIYRPNEFLRQIVSMNPGNVSIFPCSSGDKSNRQLLDFLGYLSRGGKCHTDKLEQLRPQVVSFIARHSSLIAMDLRCQVIGGAPSRELFPKALPHLYRNVPLRLFGRFQDITSELVLSITAIDAQGKPRDLVFRRRLLDCPTGDDFLHQRWAGQKILHLLSRKNSSSNNAEILQLNHQIDLLSRQYGIYGKYGY